MKQILFTVSFVLLNMSVNAQVGINAGDNPKATLEVSYSSEWAKRNKEQGILFPKLTTEQRNAMQGIHEGLVIYNTTVHCLQVFNGTSWSCTDGSNKEKPHKVGNGGATAELGSIVPLRWVALEYNGTYYSYPQNGVAPNESISVAIPYSNATNGAYTAYEKTFTLPDKHNKAKNFKLSYPAGKISNTTGTITATLTNISGTTYYPKAQPIDGQWQSLATAQVTFNGENETPYHIQAIGGVPDRCFGKTTRDCVGYGLPVKEHQFIYVPITGPDRKTWLNNNLGANYANINSSVFNPIQQAKSYDDYHAYGSLFQWQRNPDGHELMDWSEASFHPKYIHDVSYPAGSWEDAGTHNFISTARNSQSWNYNSSAGPTNLWQSNGATNPCPEGYHVPTQPEYDDLEAAIIANQSASDDRVKYANSLLHIPSLGYRLWNGNLEKQNTAGFYWSSSDIPENIPTRKYTWAWTLYFYAKGSSKTSNPGEAIGGGIRCIKN